MAVLTQAEHDSLWRNANALRDCARPHDFAPVTTDAPHRYRCAKCGGEVDGVCARFYDEGRADERATQAQA